MSESTFGVTATQVVDAAYGLTVPDSARRNIDRLIIKAENILLDNVPNLQARIDDGRVRSGSVQGVIEDMVIRVLRNPQALRSITIDDGTAVIDQAVSSGFLYLADTELTRLKGAAVRPKVRSIRLAPGWHHAR